MIEEDVPLKEEEEKKRIKFIRRSGRINYFAEFCRKRNCTEGWCSRIHDIEKIYFQNLKNDFEDWNNNLSKVFNLKTFAKEIEEKRKSGVKGSTQKFSAKHSFYIPLRNNYYRRGYERLGLSEIGKLSFSFDDYCYTRMIASVVVPFVTFQNEVFVLFGLEMNFIRSSKKRVQLNREMEVDGYQTYGGWMNCIPPRGAKNPSNEYDCDAWETARREFSEEILCRELILANNSSFSPSPINPTHNAEISQLPLYIQQFPNVVMELYSKKDYLSVGKKNERGSGCFHQFLVPLDLDDFDNDPNLFLQKMYEVTKQKENVNGNYVEKINFSFLKITDEVLDRLKIGFSVTRGEGFSQIQDLHNWQKRYESDPFFLTGGITWKEGDLEEGRKKMEEGALNFDLNKVPEFERNGRYWMKTHSAMGLIAFEKELKDAMQNGTRNYLNKVKVLF